MALSKLGLTEAERTALVELLEGTTDPLLQNVLRKAKDAAVVKKTRKRVRPRYSEVDEAIGLSHCGLLLAWTMIEEGPSGWRVVGHCTRCNEQIYRSKRVVTYLRARVTVDQIDRLNRGLGLRKSVLDEDS